MFTTTNSLVKIELRTIITKKKKREPDFPTWLTGCELMWDVSVSPSAETKTSFSATVHVEDDALGAEERPAVKKSSVILSKITN